MKEIEIKLITLGDEKYKSFMARLIPNISSDSLIGVRAPTLRKIAGNLIKSGKDKEFIFTLPHTFYDENILHAYILNEIKDYRMWIDRVCEFLPFVDNWAVCDALRPKCVSRHKNELLLQIELWIASAHPYTVRFCIEMLMLHYLGDGFSACHLQAVSRINSGDYYVKMMVAWYFATALTEQWETTLPYFTRAVLPAWIHNKAIQKAVESHRISNEKKIILRSLRI